MKKEKKIVIVFFTQTYLLDSTNAKQTIYSFWVSYIFIGIYTVEAILKLIGKILFLCPLSIRQYFYWAY